MSVTLQGQDNSSNTGDVVWMPHDGVCEKVPTEQIYFREEQLLPPLPPPPPPPPLPVENLQDVRAKELDAKERALEERERKLASAERVPNWPALLPRKVVYQDFDQDILSSTLRTKVQYVYYDTVGLSFSSPPATQTLMHTHHILMRGDATAMMATLLFNFACCTALTFGNYAALRDMVAAAAYAPLLSVGAFLVFRALYSAARTAKTLPFFLFYCGLAVETAVCLSGMLGWGGSGFAGLFWCVECLFKGRVFVASLCIMDVVLWTAHLTFCLFMWFSLKTDFDALGGLRMARREAAEKTTFGLFAATTNEPSLSSSSSSSQRT